jgi:hypothetical protein
VPEEHKSELARAAFEVLAPDAETVEVQTTAKVKFYDAGEYFAEVECPDCHAILPFEWWQERMGEDFDGEGFELADYSLPCCAAKRCLNDLVYHEAQGFARFAISAMNPVIPKISDSDVARLEVLLGTKLRVIYCHV